MLEGNGTLKYNCLDNNIELLGILYTVRILLQLLLRNTAEVLSWGLASASSSPGSTLMTPPLGSASGSLLFSLSGFSSAGSGCRPSHWMLC